MPSWIIATALASIVITALLSWTLWRMNAPHHRESDDKGGHGAGFLYGGDDGPSGTDVGGSDGGGSDGGGGGK